MKFINQTEGQKATLRFGSFFILATVMQLSAHITRGGLKEADILMTVLTGFMIVGLYFIAKKEKYAKYIIIFITIYLNVIGVTYMLKNILINEVDLGDIFALSLVTVYSYHQAGFLINTNFLWAMVTLNIGLTLWPALFLRPTLADPEAPFIASTLYLVATTIIITLKNKQDSNRREVSYKVELNSTQEKLTAKQNLLVDKEILIAKLQGQLVGSQMELAHVQSQLTDIQSQLTACHTQQRNDHKQLKAKDKELISLKTQLTTTQEQLSTTQSHLATYQTQQQNDHKQLKAYETEIANLKQQLETKNTKIEQYSQQLTEYQTLLTTYQQQRELDLTHIERLQKAVLSKIVVSVEGTLTNDPKRLKRLEDHSLLWVYTQDRGKIAIAYFGLPRQAREAGLVRGQYIKVSGPIMGVEVSDSHTLVAILAWEILFKDTSEVLTIEPKSLPLNQVQLSE